MTGMLPLLRRQAESAAMLDRQRDRMAAVLDVWSAAVLPLLAGDARKRWKNAILIAQSSLYALDLSRDEGRTGLLRFARELEGIGAACATVLPGPAPATP